MNIKKSKKDLLTFLNINEDFLSSNFLKNNFGLIVKKRKGKRDRVINPPDKKLKKIQKNILEDILHKRKISNHSFGLKNNFLKVFERHNKNYNKYLINIDIQDFFPSINYKLIFKVFLKLGFNKENSKILTKLVTYNKILPQGSPTSSYLSSLVLEDFDKQISKTSKEKGVSFSRYFDDISFSGNSKEDLFYIKNLAEIILKKINLILNEEKTCFFKKEERKEIHSIYFDFKNLYVKEKYIKEIKEDIKIFKMKDNKIFFDFKMEKKIKGKLCYCSFINNKQIKDIKKDFFIFCNKTKKRH